jgi:integrase
VARPRTPVGTFGDISFGPATGGRVRALARFRDEDGRLRRVVATADTERAAERVLKSRMSRRAHLDGHGELSPDSSFAQLVELWLEDLDLEGRLAPNTRNLYERNMRQLVMPAFEHFQLREITVSKVDRFLKMQQQKSYSIAKQSKVVLSLAFGLAVRYEAMYRNPVRETARLRRPPAQAKALTIDDVQAIRRAVAEWRRGDGLSGPKPDGQLAAIIEVMLGTSARIGEVLAIRKCDVDVTTAPATVRLCGTVITPKGKPTYRQDHPKTSKSRRTVSVPSFTAEAVRQRLIAVDGQDAEHLLFFSRNHTPLTTNNVRRRLRTILEEAGIAGVTPHAFRRTVATVIDRAGGADLAAEMLGHTSSDITRQHYIEPNDMVNPVTAAILEQLAPTDRATQI